MKNDHWLELRNWYTAPTSGGVYVIRHTVSGRSYVGKSTGIRQRIRAHGYAVSNQRLHRAIQKHGIDEFEYQVLQAGLPKEDLCALEIRTIAELGTYGGDGYNDTPGGDEGWTNRKHSAESRQKMSEVKLLKNARRGVPHTAEARERIAAGNRGKKRSAEALANMSRCRIGIPHGRPNPRAKAVLVWPLGSLTPLEFGSLQAAALWAGVALNSVAKWINDPEEERARCRHPAGHLPWAQL